jgi:hypothetical protein
MAGRAPQASGPGEVGPPSGCRRSRGCPDAGQAGRCLSVSSGPRWGCPSSRSSGHLASARPVSTRPVSSAIPGVRTDRAPVSAALPPRCPRRAGPWSSSVWRAARPGAAGRRGAVVCGRRGRLPASGRTGRGWCGVGRGWLARGSTLGQGRRLAGVPAAAPPGRRADTGAGPGQGAGRVAGEHGAEQVLTGPAGRPGQVAGVVPDHGPGSRGGDHAGWSLGWWWSRGVQLRRVYSVRWGSSLRPRRGRSA